MIEQENIVCLLESYLHCLPLVMQKNEKIVGVIITLRQKSSQTAKIIASQFFQPLTEDEFSLNSGDIAEKIYHEPLVFEQPVFGHAIFRLPPDVIKYAICPLTEAFDDDAVANLAKHGINYVSELLCFDETELKAILNQEQFLNVVHLLDFLDISTAALKNPYMRHAQRAEISVHFLIA